MSLRSRIVLGISLLQKSIKHFVQGLMSELRDSCRDVIERHFKVKVDEVCELMNDQCRNSAVKVMEFSRSEGLDRTMPPTSVSTSTRR